MNNNIDRIIKGLASACKECISVAYNDASAKKEIMRGGGSSGGIMTRLLMPRPIKRIRISEDALNKCLEYNVLAYDFFILSNQKLRKKYKCFFSSNKKKIKDCHEAGQYLTGDHNIPNTEMLKKMFEICEKNPDTKLNEYRKILNNQSYDLITIEENEKINKAGLKSTGTMEERDNCCSKKIEFTDLWLTPQNVIKQFFELSGLNKEECLDPCASDARWLGSKGMSIDILPMKKNVIKKDFLKLKKEEISSKIKYIVGNLPFSLMDKFINKSLDLVDNCYFLVNGDTIFKHFPNNIKDIYIFSGLEGNQKDNRSRCEFDVPFLIKSALWACIVHITKEKQKKWIIKKDIINNEKRNGFSVALGKNTFIKSNCLVCKNKRIKKIKVESEIKWKGGKKIIRDGEIIDLKNFTNFN